MSSEYQAASEVGSMQRLSCIAHSKYDELKKQFRKLLYTAAVISTNEIASVVHARSGAHINVLLKNADSQKTLTGLLRDSGEVVALILRELLLRRGRMQVLLLRQGLLRMLCLLRALCLVVCLLLLQLRAQPLQMLPGRICCLPIRCACCRVMRFACSSSGMHGRRGSLHQRGRVDTGAGVAAAQGLAAHVRQLARQIRLGALVGGERLGSSGAERLRARRDGRHARRLHAGVCAGVRFRLLAALQSALVV